LPTTQKDSDAPDHQCVGAVEGRKEHQKLELLCLYASLFFFLCLLLGKDMTLSLSYVSCSSLKHNKFSPSTMIMAKVELQEGVELLVTRIHSLMLRNEVMDASTAEP
jgi:hypothetical protein